MLAVSALLCGAARRIALDYEYFVERSLSRRAIREFTDELGVFVGNIKKFYAFPGTSSDSYAVKISQVITEEE